MAYLNETASLNQAEPQVMHIDLNSAFSTIEQQANPLLRGKPVGVCSYTTPGGIVLAASYEAKALGIGVGTPVREARAICPDMIFLMPDPDKYFYVNARLYALLYRYTDDLTPLSIDEFVIDFSKSRQIHRQALPALGRSIKDAIRKELGDYMRVNIGLGTNRFLAKTAAGLHKPDGLDVIDARNLQATYAKLSLRDLCGINYRYEARLNALGIFTPLDFLDASAETLHRKVFRSVEGYRWYHRLRGWEVDGVQYGRKSFGNDFSIHIATDDSPELARYLMKLCEKTGRRLRRHEFIARGAHLWLLYDNRSYWHKSAKIHHTLYSTNDIFTAVMQLFAQRPEKRPIAKLGISVFALEPTNPEQLELFNTVTTRQRQVAKASDSINDTYGDFTLIPALMMNMQNTIIKRVPFGASKDLKEIYRTYINAYL
ncbi:MAG: UmuC protein [Patescibacteria group bacterium]|jgi:DNA polymerase-4|nr:UmuC protein [Patescibacteria group bacterium]